MFGRKKAEAPAPPKGKGAALMSQMGIGDIEADLYGDLDDDEDLEAELMALQGKPKPAKKKGRGQVSASEFDIMIAESMKEVEDEDVSDTEDPDLLDELQDLAGDGGGTEEEAPVPVSGPSGGGSGMVVLLQDRLNNYRDALSAAKAANDSSKTRRADRGVKTIQDLLKKAQAGKPIDEDDIPPHMALSAPRKPDPAPQSQPTPPPISQPTVAREEPRPTPAARKPAPVSPKPAPHPVQPQQGTSSGPEASTHGSSDIELCSGRRQEYKKAALEAKHRGDIVTAKKFVQISKQFDAVIAALEAGQPVDLSQMPPPPSQTAPAFEDVVKRSEIMTGPSMAAESLQRGGEDPNAAPTAIPPPPSEDEERSIFKAPDPPKSTMDALSQRLDKYKTAEQQAKEEGNGSKARRMGRITKQYQEAIRDFKNGKPVDFDELPTPPGFAPIPVGPAAQPRPALSADPKPVPTPGVSSLNPPAGRGQGSAPQPGQRSPQPQRSPAVSPGKRPSHPSDQSQKVLKRGASLRADQQAHFLRERMQEYKNGAINAKKKGDIALAKQYLRMAKGFEPMIEASESGLPVDLTQVPPSLEGEDDNPSFVMVSREDCELSGDRDQVFEKIEQDLIAQIRTCQANNTHFSKLGDVISATKFQKMESGLQKDLEALKNALRHKDPVPKFHYENRTFSMVQCNTDLGDNDIEMTVVRGVQYNPPDGYSEKNLDTYVKYEFPFPTDDPQTGHTETVKSSLNPEYQEPVKMTMNRKSRALVRVIERKTIKLEIFYKRGFLKSDKLLGTVNVKLLPLETQCTLHDSYDLCDGRKTLGGKLEVKVRIRDPFKSKQVEEVKEKWLVIDQFIKTLDAPSARGAGSEKNTAPRSRACMIM
ncbi:coiled-coil and C2 domain-containing protein 1-like isoform X2 [Mya arenaria]|uniref:coiled-coil and C2 domain-containing protein 1-like isoform X2 n=1 Tax=Mya arenaria TaxID=6604 RepID=UPI0022E7D581|nr:coiled-coil and C2 domain-containing protein 1-like isoform X2 [Mya arenaria]